MGICLQANVKASMMHKHMPIWPICHLQVLVCKEDVGRQGNGRLLHVHTACKLMPLDALHGIYALKLELAVQI